MKASLTILVLLLTPGHGYVSNSKPVVLEQRSSEQLQHAEGVIDVQTSASRMNKDMSTRALEKHLGYSENSIQDKYSKWLKQYGKVASDYRYAIFKNNFLAQEDYNRRAGASFSLNEGGDITPKEAKINTLRRVLGYSEEVVRDQYIRWLAQHEKIADEYRYVTFKHNFLVQEQYNRKFGKSFSLNEYGDMTEQEAKMVNLQKDLGYSEAAIRDRYSNWVIRYNNIADESRYVTFKHNFLMQEEYNRKAGVSFSLNQYADMSAVEYRDLRAKTNCLSSGDNKMKTEKRQTVKGLDILNFFEKDVTSSGRTTEWLIQDKKANITPEAADHQQAVKPDEEEKSEASAGDTDTMLLEPTTSTFMDAHLIVRKEDKIVEDDQFQLPDFGEHGTTANPVLKSSGFRGNNNTDNITVIAYTNEDHNRTTETAVPVDEKQVNVRATVNSISTAKCQSVSLGAADGTWKGSATEIGETPWDSQVSEKEKRHALVGDSIAVTAATVFTFNDVHCRAAVKTDRVATTLDEMVQEIGNENQIKLFPETDETPSVIVGNQMNAEASRMSQVTEGDHPFLLEALLTTDVVDAIKAKSGIERDPLIIEEAIPSIPAIAGLRDADRVENLTPVIENSEAGEEDEEAFLEAVLTPAIVEAIKAAQSTEFNKASSTNEKEVAVPIESRTKAPDSVEEEDRNMVETVGGVGLQAAEATGLIVDNTGKSCCNEGGVMDELVATRMKYNVEIMDETEIFVDKYRDIENVEERAFEILKDLKFVAPAPQHFSFSYFDEIPELRLEGGAPYIDALHNPELSAIEGSATFSTYLSSIPVSESGTFEDGKSGTQLGAATNYLEDICEMLEPFIDCDKELEERTPIAITSPVEDFVYKKAAQIKNLGDKAFRVLVELCSIGRCERR